MHRVYQAYQTAREVFWKTITLADVKESDCPGAVLFDFCKTLSEGGFLCVEETERGSPHDRKESPEIEPGGDFGNTSGTG